MGAGLQPEVLGWAGSDRVGADELPAVAILACDDTPIGDLHWVDLSRLANPDRSRAVRALDLAEVGALTFEAPDPETFRCLALARDAAVAGGTAPCMLNAANEVAVHAFLGEELRFLDIARVIEGTLDAIDAVPVQSFDDLYEADADARQTAFALVKGLAVSA